MQASNGCRTICVRYNLWVQTPTPDKQRVTRDVVIALRRIVRAIELHSQSLVHNVGLTGPQLLVLQALAEFDGVASAGTLARAVHLSQATVTGILDRLERHGHATRLRSTTDKRRVLVSLTPRAEELLAQAPQPLQHSFTRRFAELEEWERTQMLSVLQRVVAMLEARDLAAPPVLDEFGVVFTAGAASTPPDARSGDGEVGPASTEGDSPHVHPGDHPFMAGAAHPV